MSLDAAQIKDLKSVNPCISNVVFGFIRQSVVQLFGENKFSNVFSLIQFICLRYYWQKDKWDPLHIGTGLELKNNIITKVEAINH